MYKALIVGCGKIAGSGSIANDLKTHAAALIHQSRIDLVAVMDCKYETAEQFGAKYGCDAFDNLELAMINVQPDLVCICTPDNTHFDVTKRVLLSENPPKIIFLEKPACQTRIEYNYLAEVSKDRNIKIVVNHTRRFNPKFLALKYFINLQSFGALHRVNAIYYSGWFHNGTHIIDTLLFLLGDEIQWNVVNHVTGSPYLDDPTLELSGKFLSSNAEVVISAINEKYYQLFEFDFWFENARLRIEDFGSRIRCERKFINSFGESVLEEVKLKLPEDYGSEMQIAIDLICNFLDAGEEKRLNHVSLQELMPTMKALWDGYDLLLNKGGVCEN